MAFKMNGSPMHSGTAAHKSALKMAEKSPAKDKKIIDGTADAPAHNAKLATDAHYGDPHGPKPSDKPAEVKEAAESGALKMKSPAKQRMDSDGKLMKENQKVTEQRVKKEDGKKRLMKKELKPVKKKRLMKKELKPVKKKRLMKKELKTLKKPKEN